jgi:hypothetical protein
VLRGIGRRPPSGDTDRAGPTPADTSPSRSRGTKAGGPGAWPRSAVHLPARQATPKGCRKANDDRGPVGGTSIGTRAPPFVSRLTPSGRRATRARARGVAALEAAQGSARARGAGEARLGAQVLARGVAPEGPLGRSTGSVPSEAPARRGVDRPGMDREGVRWGARSRTAPSGSSFVAGPVACSYPASAFETASHNSAFVGPCRLSFRPRTR